MNFSALASKNGLFCDGDWIEKKDQDPKGTVRLIQLADIGVGEFRDKSSRYITEETGQNLHCTYLQKGDILIARLPEPLGRACFFPLEGRYITAVDIAILRIERPDVLPQFVMYMINSPQFRHEIKKYESGTTRKRISRRNLDRIQFSIPPLPEQKRIVARIEELFSQLANGVETLKMAKQQLAVYRQAVLKEAFSSVTTKKPIREMSCLVTSGSRGWAKYYASKGARFIRITDLTRDRIDLKNDSIQYVSLPDVAEGKRSRLMPNDVLVSITADLGSVALIPPSIGESYINQHIAMIRFFNAKQGKYMAWYLKSDYGQKDLLRNKRGGGKLGLGLDDIRNTQVPVVDDDSARKTLAQIESRMSVCDSIEQTIGTALQQVEALQQSIMKKAFEGVAIR